MKPLALGCLGFLVAPILIIIGFGVLAATPAFKTATAQVAPRSSLSAPVQVGTWSTPGSDLTTPPFTLAGSSARLDYTIDPDKYGHAQLCVYATKADGTHVKAECLQGSGTTYLYVKPGTYYLKASAVSGPWTLTVTDLP